MNNINGLPPFKRLCVTIGNLPSSYVDSMSYYECLMWLCKYLKDTVVPAINENAEAVNDLINWFNNLDVQDEIDNKLDKMVESGELEEIITEYLQVNGVLGYNTVADMVSATNLIDGSICRTLGLNTYKDGKGAFYKIRTITSQDVVDGINIIALNISNTLIAEKIPDKPLKHIIIIGDSYGAGITTVGQTTSNVTPYTEYARQFIGYPTTHFHAFGSNGAGFTHLGSGGYTFLTSLKTFDTSLSNVADDVSEIYVFGGINDRDSSISDILNAIKDFVDYAKLKYPNAKVYIGELGRFNGLSFADEHSKIQQVSIPAYSQCQQVGAIYISGTEHIMQINSLFSDDNVHPSENGYVIVGKYIGQAILNKYCNVTKEVTNVTLTPNSNITFTTFDLPLTEKIDNGEIYLLSSQATLNSSTPIAWGSGNILKIADFVLPYGNVSLGTGISEDVIAIINDSTMNKTFIVPGKLLFQRNGELGLYAPIIDSTGTSYVSFTNVRAISMKLQYQTKQISGNLL